MSRSTTATTELTTQYAAQVTSDLDRNLQEQDRVGAEIATLQEQLAALKHDHSVLLNVQKALGLSSAPVPPATVPAPRKKPAAEPATGKRTRGKKADTAQGRATTKKPAAKAVAAKGAKPTLVELVRGHLTAQNEPCSAAEVTTALGAAHPERGIKTTVIRNTLEGLVAKNQAERTKQGSSVFYAAPGATARTAAPAESEPQPEQAEQSA
ncbi:hypothetical protein NGF19_07220 [Streptomyces sp. RY43-2]|uniref:Regulatory protein n=1 Tax=Streptomyces macrolidinus TaxID=2952607 RepID=A0ABT0ZCE5_9ACTN|nr:hypothetical protein [Streptomyces macrolidinus]MCN9240586.1 hypothetical protein [Streptomyces macrolidinus]